MYEFDNCGQGIDLLPWTWRAILEIAHNYGWKPAGTEDPEFDKPPNGQWDGNYLEGALQKVKYQDAINLGNTLEKAVLDIFSGSYKTKHLSRKLKLKLKELEKVEGHKNLVQYVCFFKQGHFTIWR